MNVSIVRALRVAAVVGAVAGIGQLRADTCRWNNATGDGCWATSGNWEDGAAPATGDTIVISASDAERTMTNDLDTAVEIVAVRIEGVNRGKVNIAGTNALTLTGSPCWSSTNALDVACPLRLVPSGGNSYLHAGCAAGSSVDFRGAIEFVGDWKTFVPQMPPIASGVTDGPVHFYGTVTTSKNSDVAPYLYSSGVYMYFHEKVTTRRFKSNGYESGRVTLYSTENDWDLADVSWAYHIVAGAANVFTPTAPLHFVAQGGPSPKNGCYDLMSFDQTANCLMSHDITKNPPPGNVTSTDAVTLTLNGTQDAWTSAAIGNRVTIVWNPTGDFTQAFSNRASTTTGDLVVRNGRILLGGTCSFSNSPNVSVSGGATFVHDATVSGALAGVRVLTLASNATFRVGTSAASPFGGFVRAILDTEAKFVFDGTQTLTVAQMVRDGQMVADATYTADGRDDTVRADWIDGSGAVTVDSDIQTGYIWKTAVSGNWEDAANWAGGVVPSSATAEAVTIDAIGADYTVSVADGTTLPKNLTVGTAIGSATVRIAGDRADVSCPIWSVARGGTIEVVETGRLVCDFAANAKGSALTVDNGGTFLVNGGEAVITNMCNTGAQARLVVGGHGTNESRVAVTAGALWISGLNQSCYAQLNEGGVVETRGGILHLASKQDLESFKMNGGSIRASGDGVFELAGSYSSRLTFRRGTHVFSGSSEFANLGSANPRNCSYPRICPDAGAEACLRFTEHAKIGNWGSTWVVGDVAGGKGYLDFASDQVHGWDGSDNRFIIGLTVALGGVRGYGEMTVSDGSVGVGWAGLTVGGPMNFSKTANIEFEGSEGVLKVSGGKMPVYGYYRSGWNSTTLGGLCVGYGGAIPTDFTPTGRPYRGRVEVTGGELASVYGHFVIGTGYATGEVVQNGGCVRVDQSSYWEQAHLIVGFAGGEGVYTMSNGVFSANYDAYVGGVVTNGLGPQVAILGDNANLPVHRHDAEGRIAFAGGAFSVTNTAKTAALILGADGCGTLERVGTNGVCRVSNLILTNTVANAASGGTLKFTLNETGCGGIVVENDLVLGDNAKLEVDVGAYRLPHRAKLLSAAKIEGCFSEIAICGERKDVYRITRNGTDVCLHPVCGTVLLFR